MTQFHYRYGLFHRINAINSFSMGENQALGILQWRQASPCLPKAYDLMGERETVLFVNTAYDIGVGMGGVEGEGNAGVQGILWGNNFDANDKAFRTMKWL